MTRKKGAIGLSINVLVVIIISLVVLVGGVSLLYKFIGGAEDIKESLDQRTNERLENLLVDQGKRVALPFNTKTVPRGESHLFGIGVLNIREEEERFHIEVELSRAVGETGEEIVVETTEWLLYDSDPVKLAENEHHKTSILVSVPEDVLKGQYIFNAKVFIGDEQYGNTQKFTVTVE